MADWFGTARSNYFEVNDPEKFEAFCEKWDLEPNSAIIEGKKLYMFIADTYNGGLPSSLYVEDEDGEIVEELYFKDFLRELTTHLKPGYVAILIEVGNEALRYLTGSAVAINHKGESISIDLTSAILKEAEKLGEIVTPPEY